MAREDKVAVDLVHHQDDVVFQAEICDLFYLFLRPHPSDRVMRAAEDQSPDRQALRQKLLSKLEIKIQETRKETKTVDPHELLMAAVFSLGVLGSILGQLSIKLSDNFDLLFYVKRTFFVKFMEALKKVAELSDSHEF